ncbi:MAG: hypothetical protein COA43_14225 [Robiginitomaculum sp.]|nr:MAG: hypothetical protein COA43_14225 [Robiginitomaculum sp.]
MRVISRCEEWPAFKVSNTVTSLKVIMFRSLARANIGEQWKLFLAAIVVLTLSGNLMLITVGVMGASVRSMSAFPRSLDVDLYITPIKKKKWQLGSQVITLGKSLPETLVQDLNIFSEIETLGLFEEHFSFKSLQTPTGRTQLFIFSLDSIDRPLLIPRIITSETIAKLKIPGTILLSHANAKRMGVSIGDTIITFDGLNELKVIGIVYGELGRVDFTGSSRFNFISVETAELIQADARPYSIADQSLLVKIKEGYDVNATQTRLNAYLKTVGLEAVSSKTYSEIISTAQILKSKQFQGFLIVGLFSVVISLFIIVQTLQSALLAQKTQFATLRALGVPFWRLSAIAMEQSFWVGIIGAFLSIGIASAIKVQLIDRGIIIYTPLNFILVICFSILMAALIAGVFSIFSIMKAKPVELLR